MQKIIILIMAALLCVAPALADNPVSMDQAHPQGNVSIIVQHGDGNLAVTEQSGFGNFANLNQSGSNDTAAIISLARAARSIRCSRAAGLPSRSPNPAKMPLASESNSTWSIIFATCCSQQPFASRPAWRSRRQPRIGRRRVSPRTSRQVAGKRSPIRRFCPRTSWDCSMIAGSRPTPDFSCKAWPRSRPRIGRCNSTR